VFYFTQEGRLIQDKTLLYNKEKKNLTNRSKGL